MKKLVKTKLEQTIENNNGQEYKNNPDVKIITNWLFNKHDKHPFLLTGKAGTGKSTIIKHLYEECKKNKMRCSVIAPTGVAALNVDCDATTIHSFFNFPPTNNYFIQKKYIDDMTLNRHTNISQTDVLIIDEISMVSSIVLDAIDYLFREVKKNKNVFGGIKVLLVGDMFQLPPIISPTNKEEYYKEYSSEYFFDSHSVQKALKTNKYYLNLELREIHRQKDEKFINFLNNVRNNTLEDNDFDYINKRVTPFDLELFNDNSKFNVILACTNNIVKNYNQQLLDSLPTELITSTATINRIYEWYPTSMYPTDVQLKFKIGSQIMFVNNDKQKRWVNGTMAKILEIQNGKVTVLTDSGKLLDVERFTFEFCGYRWGELTVLSEFIQYPFKLAWSITIHKAQGLTFDNVVVDFGEKVTGNNMVYVALSRCRTYEGISLVRPLRKEDVRINYKVKNYKRNFGEIN